MESSSERFGPLTRPTASPCLEACDSASMQCIQSLSRAMWQDATTEPMGRRRTPEEAHVAGYSGKITIDFLTLASHCNEVGPLTNLRIGGDFFLPLPL